MKKFPLIFIALILMPGCAWWGGLFGGGDGSAGGVKTDAKSARQQLNEAWASFDSKIKSSPGKKLSDVQKEWGKLEKGLSQNDLTVYRWSQTAKVTAPAGEVAPVSNSGQQTTSCLAMFIVSGDGAVVDATNEGQCLDYSLMPAWKPFIVESTDGRNGFVHRDVK